MIELNELTNFPDEGSSKTKLINILKPTPKSTHKVAIPNKAILRVKSDSRDSKFLTPTLINFP